MLATRRRMDKSNERGDALLALRALVGVLLSSHAGDHSTSLQTGDVIAYEAGG